jgi:hypothetical protein
VRAVCVCEGPDICPPCYDFIAPRLAHQQEGDGAVASLASRGNAASADIGGDGYRFKPLGTWDDVLGSADEVC